MNDITRNPEIYLRLIKSFVRQLPQARYFVSTLALCDIISMYVEKWALAMNLK